MWTEGPVQDASRNVAGILSHPPRFCEVQDMIVFLHSNILGTDNKCIQIFQKLISPDGKCVYQVFSSTFKQYFIDINIHRELDHKENYK